MAKQDNTDPTPTSIPAPTYKYAHDNPSRVKRKKPKRIKALALSVENHAKFMELKKIAGEQQGFSLNVWQFLCVLMQLWEKHNTDNETSE